MLKIEKSIVINAPIEEVFAYANDPTHTPEYRTEAHEVTDVRRLPGGGYSYKAVYKLAGMRTDVTGEDIEVVPNERFVSQARSALDDVNSTVVFERVDGDKTRVTSIDEHTLHGGVLGKLGESFFAKYFDHAAELAQATMKAHIEAGRAAPVR